MSYAILATIYGIFGSPFLLPRFFEAKIAGAVKQPGRVPTITLTLKPKMVKNRGHGLISLKHRISF